MKMNISKKLAAAAAAVMLLTACGSGADTADTSDVQTTAETAAAEDTVSEETAAPEEEAASDWTELDSTQITEEMGLGWNLGNQFEAVVNGTPEETAWGNPVVTEDLIKTVKEQGFSGVRIPVTYLSKIGDAPDYTIDAAWLDRVAEVVDYVIDNDMYAIINMHGDGYYTIDGAWLLCAEDDAAQEEIKAKYEAAWTQIADRFKDYDEHLIFESMNEEFNNDYGKPDAAAYANINAYNQIFVDAVRGTGSNNEKRWLLIPGWNTNIEYTAGNYGFVIPEDKLCTADGNRLMISVHFYDPYNFTLDGNAGSATIQWGQYATEKYDSWGQEDYVDTMMKKLNDTFVSQGYPVIIGEFGTINKTNLDENNAAYRRYWSEYVVKASKSNGIIPVYWDNGWNGDGGLAVIDRTTLSVTQPEIIEGMVRAITSDSDYEIPAVE